jgi:hypothetical protein
MNGNETIWPQHETSRVFFLLWPFGAKIMTCELRGHFRLSSTPSLPNYKTFEFFDPKFDYSSYSKKFVQI